MLLLLGGELRLAGNEPGLAPRDTKTPVPPSSENASDLDSERQTRIVLAGFKCDDRAASYSDLRGKLCLRPFLFRSQDAQASLHRYRHEYRINPRLHKTIMSGGMPSHDRERNPKLWKRPMATEKTSVPAKANVNAWKLTCCSRSSLECRKRSRNRTAVPPPAIVRAMAIDETSAET